MGMHTQLTRLGFDSIILPLKATLCQWACPQLSVGSDEHIHVEIVASQEQPTKMEDSDPLEPAVILEMCDSQDMPRSSSTHGSGL